VSARDEIAAWFAHPYDVRMPVTQLANELLDAYRAEVLREAADAVVKATGNALDANAKLLRRIADEAEHR
jgi:hypothetical protein